MQLTELWSLYGKLFEVWFDGGVMAPEKGGFDVLSLLKKHQPDAIAFQGPFGYENNIRWVGNENGVAPYPCWASADSTTSATGVIQIKGLNGNPEGKFWCPGEADFPLRKNASFQGGWFWHKDQDDQLRSLNELMERYYKSVGRNTNMLLGIVVDDRGLVPEPDMLRLMEFGDEINRRFSNPIGSTSGAGEKINLKLANEHKVNLVVLMEDIAKGERIRKFVLEGKTNKGWEKIFEGSCIGHKFIHQFDAIEVSSVRLNVLESSGEPQLLNISVYYIND